MIHSLSHFEAIVGYHREEIRAILADKERYYYHFSQSKGIVKGEEIFRHYHPSKKALKDLHNRIHSRIFSPVELPPHIQGCVKGRDNVKNAKCHQGKLYKFHTDLKSYFDFVSTKKVNTALRNFGFSPTISHLITDITTYRGHLPQGAPTSPFLANIAGLAIDREIIRLCNENDIVYTRYVDDLCLSSQTDFKPHIPRIIEIINQQDFLIGFKKTVYKKGHLEITGADVCNDFLRPTRKQLKKYLDPAIPAHTAKGMEIYFEHLKNS